VSARLFSGIQPSGDIHIGNYLGAIRNWVDLIPRFECIYCVVDLHAITIPYEPAEMQSRILEAAAVNIACGIDPERCTLFVQSYVPEHTELAWLLNTITPIGDLQRMTQFKDKAKQLEEKKMDAGASKTGHPPAGAGGRESVNAGLLNYPVLMAADILLYKAEVVPVGEDQVQHLELAREITRRFNSRFGPIFPEPKERLTAAARIMGLDDPTKKMSKSSGSDNSYIAVMDPPDAMRRKIKRAVTDSGTEVRGGPDKPALTNLLDIYSALSGETVAAVEQRYEGKGYADFKSDLGEVVVEALMPIQARIRELEADKSYTLEVLKSGAERAEGIAGRTLAKVRERIGLVRRP
jgi:tryptophanyl-tRNA synthetase